MDPITPDTINPQPVVAAPAHGSEPPPLPDPESLRVGGNNRFENDYHALPAGARAGAMVEALLKSPGALVYEITRGRSGPVQVVMLALAVVCAAAYGLVMGTFAGGSQYGLAALKVAAGTALSALICFPSLYIFSSLAGSRQNLITTLGLMLLFMALSGLLLIGFAPIAWVFSQSTNSLMFMGTLHLCFWLVAAAFGLRLLTSAFAFLNRRNMLILNLWAVIYVVVALQMSTALRPLLGKPVEGRWLEGRKFFLVHWGECLSQSERD